MKHIFFIILLTISSIVFAQEEPKTIEFDKFYTSVGGEYIFSFANTNQDIETTDLRFSGWLHLQFNWHYNFSKKYGAYIGLGSRNIGYTSTPESNNNYLKNFTVYDDNLKEYQLNNTFDKGDKITTIKRRVYTLSIPVGLKIGNLEKDRFIFFGGEIEIPFHYKNKAWVNDSKEEINSWWFSNQTNPYLLSSFIGVQFPGGANLKFKWYFTDLMNNDYTVQVNNHEIKPYNNFKSQMFYISFGMSLYDAKRHIKRIKTIRINRQVSKQI